MHPGYRQQLLEWGSQFSSCCFLDNQGYQSLFHRHDFLAGVGCFQSFSVTSASTLQHIDDFLHRNKGRWIFAHLAYPLFSVLHGIPTSKSDEVGFSLATFFVPEFVFKTSGGNLEITAVGNSADAKTCWQEVLNTPIKPIEESGKFLSLHARQTKADYVQTIHRLQDHIVKGDCYEINYCQEFFSTEALVSPTQLYPSLLSTSPNPFSCFYKQGYSYLLCASPERFLTRRNRRLISQPIKGTAPRNLEDPIADAQLKTKLLNSQKEQSENVMVVDLVRNDLSRICEKGSVVVDELFGIYSFPQVHQMISTISGLQNADLPFSELVKAMFPMGSMTGAPKIRVMELIEKYEKSSRGLFSGAVGYINPEGDFDFNVVIRSILYNAKNKYLSYQVGSGITFNSQPEKEYEECFWKSEAIRRVLGA